MYRRYIQAWGLSRRLVSFSVDNLKLEKLLDLAQVMIRQKANLPSQAMNSARYEIFGSGISLIAGTAKGSAAVMLAQATL
jgi:hypothetical protein